MRITESRLRKIIRQVIKESVRTDPRQMTDKKDFYQYLMTGITKAFPVRDDQTYSFSFYDQGRKGFSMTVNGRKVDQKELKRFLEDLYYEHTTTRSKGWLPLNICLKLMIGFLEAEGLITKTTYNARGRKELEYSAMSDEELNAKRDAFRQSFFGK